MVLFYKRKILDNPLRIFCCFILVSALADLIGFLCFLQGVSTVPLFKIYTLVEGSILLVFFAYVFHSQYRKVLIFLFLPLFMVLGVLCELYSFQFNIVNTIECVLFLLISSYYFYDVVFLRFNLVQSEYSYTYAINVAIFLYFGVNLVLFFFEETVRYSSPLFRNISWSIHQTTQIVFNILISVGIARKR